MALEAIAREFGDVIKAQNNSFDWASAVSALCSVISLIAIVVLLKERKEKQRPYLQVSFELIKGSLVCLVIRNVGEMPAKLLGISFDPLFVDQLPPSGKEHAKNRVTNISIYPKQYWVMCLDVIAPEVLRYQNTQLQVTLSYSSKERRKVYMEKELIDFNDYSGFLVYISETDELKQEVKKLGGSLEKVGKELRKLANNNPPTIQTQAYSNVADTVSRTIVIGNDGIEVLQKAEEHTND